MLPLPGLPEEGHVLVATNRGVLGQELEAGRRGRGGEPEAVRR